MSNAAYLGDGIPFSQAESSAEQLIRMPGNEDCNVCRGLRLPDPDVINTTYGELKRKAIYGCELCALLLLVNETGYIGRDIMAQETDEIMVVGDKKVGFGGGAPYLYGRAEAHTYERNFYAAIEDNCPWPFMVWDHAPVESASIQIYATLIKRMLHTCDTAHTACNTDDFQQSSWGVKKSKFIPKRLLHICGDSVPFQVRLCESVSDDASLKGLGLRYTALSHCWGTTPTIKTTTATISGFKTEGMNWSSLPKTFQEAISLTHELGLHYVWIDSLCILQDSVPDWADQASQMAEIYSNAYITIAASASENGQQGLLNRGGIYEFETVHNGKNFPVRVRRPIRHEFRDNGHDVIWTLTDLPLRVRAWCLQEELLSARIIHFTQDEINFVCREATTCECQPDWVPRFTLPPFVGTSIDQPLKIWGSIVEHFTMRQISFNKDRLPALSSLTRFFEKDSGRYLAGLWESQLPGSLLWNAPCGERQEPDHESRSKPPSWSWASIKGPVFYSQIAKRNRKQGPEVLDVHTYLSTNDPRGMVSGGHVTLRGPMFPLKGIRETLINTTYTSDRYMNHLHMETHYLDGPRSSGGPYHFTCPPGWARGAQSFSWAQELHWAWADVCYCIFDQDAMPGSVFFNEIVETPIFLLVIHDQDTVCRQRDDDDPYNTFPGLLLQPLDELNTVQTRMMKNSKSKLAFVRIGYGEMRLKWTDSERALARFGNTIVTVF